MFTPQQIQEISFEKVRFGGYDMDSVDEILEPLTQDYLTLYKENSVLKSKLRILVEKLEEYRRQEGAMQNAILSAQKTSEQMVAEAEKKCAKILREAEQTAQNKTSDYLSQAAAEEERLKAAQQACNDFFDSMEKRLKRQIELIGEIRDLKPEAQSEMPKAEPKPHKPERRAFDFNIQTEPKAQQANEADIIEQIDQNLEEKLSGGMSIHTEAYRPDANRDTEYPQFPPKRFEDLQFGRNYHPNGE
ncbi:MAG: DivIVA domain-containing protein [Ruminococcaceae bacterium]|nr:DivIVA domain-containing protein [Oscillospiraceae bacterium]